MKIKNLIILLVINIFLVIGLSAKENAGTTTAQFLNLGIGAKAIAMGNAYIANTNDASSVYWNPAGLGGLKKSSILLMHGVWLEETSYSWMSLAIPTKIGGFGFGAQYVNYGEMQGYDNDGIKTESFVPADKMFSLSYGFKIKRLSLGATGKYIESEIEKTIKMHSTDIGMKLAITKSLNLAVMARNYFGDEIAETKDHTKDPLPKFLEVGLGYKNKLGTFMFEANVKQDQEDKDNLLAGAGFELRTPISNESSVAIRGGYNTLTKDVEGLQGLSAGFGLKINRLSIDYAYKPIGELGDTHLVSIGIEV